MPKIEQVEIEWQEVKHRRHTGVLVIKLPSGYNSIDFLRNTPPRYPERDLEKLIGCFECPAYLKDAPGDEGIAYPVYGYRFDEKDDKPSLVHVHCGGTDVDAKFTTKTVCRNKYVNPQKVDAKLGD